MPTGMRAHPPPGPPPAGAGRLTHNKTGDFPSVMYFYNGMPHIFRHSVNIYRLYSNKKYHHRSRSLTG
jgi:hypothetical protein